MEAINTSIVPLADDSNASGSFQISQSELIALVNSYKRRTSDEDIKVCKELGGTEGISKKLKVDVTKGLSADSFPAREECFGNNQIEKIKAKTFGTISVQVLKDLMLLILIVVATIQLIVAFSGAYPLEYTNPWLDGIAIYVACLIVAVCAALIDWHKEKEFVKRSQDGDDDESFKFWVNRPDETGEAKTQEVQGDSIHVGDIVHLRFGMVIPVDGIVLSANELETNEAELTGSHTERKKETIEKCIECLEDTTLVKTDSHSLPSPVLLAGTSVAGGDGKMLTIMVGEKSTHGVIMDERNADQIIAQTKKPKAMRMGKIVLAVLIVLGIFFRFAYQMGWF